MRDLDTNIKELEEKQTNFIYWMTKRNYFESNLSIKTIYSEFLNTNWSVSLSFVISNFTLRIESVLLNKP